MVRYTIKDVPNELDQKLRLMAQSLGVNLNTFLLDCLIQGANQQMKNKTGNDLKELYGKWLDSQNSASHSSPSK